MSTVAVLCTGLAALVLISSVLPQPTGGAPGLAGQDGVLTLSGEMAVPGALLAASLVATATWQWGGTSRGRGVVTVAAATALLVALADARLLPAALLRAADQSHPLVPWLAAGAAVTASGLLVAATTWVSARPPEGNAPGADRAHPRRLLVTGSAAAVLLAMAAGFLVLLGLSYRGGWNSTGALANWCRAVGGGLVVGALVRFAIRSSLRPVETLNHELQEITASHALDQRVTVPEVGTLTPWLARTINVTLDRVFAGVARQQRFIADASHELRSPIANLRASLESSLAHPEKVDWPETVRDALTDIDRLQHLTDDLLLLARLDDTAPAAGTPVDLAALAHDLVEEFRHLRVHQKLCFTFYTDDSVYVPGNAVQLERLLRNLLDNAARHARTITDITVTAGADGLARVEIRDDGPGIPPADRERIFERFTRLDGARARGTGGAGLGLAIAREIAVRHGGTLHAAPNPSGALLIADLPLGR